jgi:hypothetical protein
VSSPAIVGNGTDADPVNPGLEGRAAFEGRNPAANGDENILRDVGNIRRTDPEVSHNSPDILDMFTIDLSKIAAFVRSPLGLLSE